MSAPGVSSSQAWRVMYLGILLVLYVVLASCTPLPTAAPKPTDTPAPPPEQKILPITVLNEKGEPLNEGVVVRVSNPPQVDDFDNDGLWVETCDQNTQALAAWADGYEVALRKCNEPNIQLTPLNGQDNSAYTWTAAIQNCIYCHSGQLGGYDEMNEWLKSGHSNILSQRYFESMYRGINVRGASSPRTEWRVVQNHRVRVPPDVNNNYYGPGFKLDFPDQPGNCAVCHVPAAVTPSQPNVDLSSYFPFNRGDARDEGVTCDICHKVLDVTLDNTGFPFVDRPGILSFKFLRPDIPAFAIGPFANLLISNSNSLTDHRLTCSSIFSKSEFCAACHYGKFGDMVIYNSYGEWKGSAYGDNPNEADYRTCQDCHMSHMQPGGEYPPSSRRQACSETDINFQNFDHNLMNLGFDQTSGKQIPLMIKDAARLNVKFKYEPDKKNSLNVIVRVQNTNVGHKFPTDSPLRHLILVVEAKDRFGTTLLQVDGERIPNWGGMGKPFMDGLGIKNYGGLPGKIFANLLVEEDTNVSPTAAYWNETKFAWTDGADNSDTRLSPGEEDRSDYFFTVPDNGQVSVTVTLVYRYAFFDLIAQKEWWNRADIVVTSVKCEGPPTQADKIDCEAIE